MTSVYRTISNVTRSLLQELAEVTLETNPAFDSQSRLLRSSCLECSLSHQSVQNELFINLRVLLFDDVCLFLLRPYYLDQAFFNTSTQ